MVKNFVFPSKLATFLPSHRTTPLNTVLVQIISVNKACYARVHLILEDGTVSIIAEPALPVDPTVCYSIRHFFFWDLNSFSE